MPANATASLRTLGTNGQYMTGGYLTDYLGRSGAVMLKGQYSSKNRNIEGYVEGVWIDVDSVHHRGLSVGGVVIGSDVDWTPSVGETTIGVDDMASTVTPFISGLEQIRSVDSDEPWIRVGQKYIYKNVTSSEVSVLPDISAMSGYPAGSGAPLEFAVGVIIPSHRMRLDVWSPVAYQYHEKAEDVQTTETSTTDTVVDSTDSSTTTVVSKRLMGMLIAMGSAVLFFILILCILRPTKLFPNARGSTGRYDESLIDLGEGSPIFSMSPHFHSYIKSEIF